MAKRNGATTAAAEAPGYRVLRGISWHDPSHGQAERGWVNVAAGTTRSDLPTKHLADWIACAAIEPADAPPPDTSGSAAEEA
jgi:hypothetical protein